MRIRLLNLLLLAALALAASRLWAFLREPPPALPPIAAESASAEGWSGALEGPPAPVEARPEAFDVIVARDLFSPRRGVVPPAAAAAAQPPPKPQPAPKLTLYGVVILDGEKAAFLQEGAQEARPKKVREMEGFAGGTVTAIRPDGVTFLFGGNEVSIPLRTPKEVAPRGPDAGAAPAAARTPTTVPRRAQPPAVVPGQMPGQVPAGAEQGRVPRMQPQTPAAPGMPIFPSAAEPSDDGGGPDTIMPDEGFDNQMPDSPLGGEDDQ